MSENLAPNMLLGGQLDTKISLLGGVDPDKQLEIVKIAIFSKIQEGYHI